MILTNSNKNDILNLSLGKADFLCQTRPRVCVASLTDFPNDRRNGAFLLEGNMKSKQCYKCKIIKPVEKFSKYASGINKGYYGSYCKECVMIDNRKRRKLFPWLKTLNLIKNRCNNKNSRYCQRGIKNYLTKKDIKYLWDRDYADGFKYPSIDRKDTTGNYTLDNCRFIELEENRKRKRTGRMYEI